MNMLDAWVEIARPLYPELSDMELISLRNTCFKKYVLGGTVDPELYERYLQWRTYREMGRDYV